MMNFNNLKGFRAQNKFYSVITVLQEIFGFYLKTIYLFEIIKIFNSKNFLKQIFNLIKSFIDSLKRNE